MDLWKVANLSLDAWTEKRHVFGFLDFGLNLLVVVLISWIEKQKPHSYYSMKKWQLQSSCQFFAYFFQLNLFLQFDLPTKQHIW